MDKSKSKRVMTGIAISAAAAILACLVIRGYELEKYALDKVSSDMYFAIEELENMNETIFCMLVEGEEKIEKDIDAEHVRSLEGSQFELGKTLKIPYGDFSWLDVMKIEWDIQDIMKKKELTEADKAYLKTVHSYNERLVEQYREAAKTKGIEQDEIEGMNHRQFKKVYREFLKSANKMAKEKDYADMMEFETENERDIAGRIGPEEAEMAAKYAIEKAVGEKGFKLKREDSEPDEYTFLDEWPGKNEDNAYAEGMSEEDKEIYRMLSGGNNIYHTTIDANTGSLSMYRETETNEGAIPEPEIDKKARKAKEIFADGNYVCYARDKMFYDDGLGHIKYRFIRKEGEVYDESGLMDISINTCGSISEVYISDCVPVKKDPKLQPKISKESIAAKIPQGNVQHVLLVSGDDRIIQYRVFVKLDGKIYECSFDAQSGNMIDYSRADALYYERVDNI